MDSFVEYKSLYYEKTNQFKIIQPRNLSHKRRGSASREQAVDIAFFLNINDRINGFTQQFGHFCHVLSIVCFPVEAFVHLFDRLRLSTAQQPDIVQHFLGFR